MLLIKSICSNLLPCSSKLYTQPPIHPLSTSIEQEISWLLQFGMWVNAHSHIPLRSLRINVQLHWIDSSWFLNILMNWCASLYSMMTVDRGNNQNLCETDQGSIGYAGEKILGNLNRGSLLFHRNQCKGPNQGLIILKIGWERDQGVE
jgi:hypothetical protein